MNRLEFKVKHSIETNEHEVRILIDGLDVISSIDKDAIGLDPPDLFTQSSLLNGGKLLIGCCQCGVMGCDDVGITVDLSDRGVTWSLFGSRQRMADFERRYYDEVVQQQMDDHSWETVERAAERHVAGLSFDKFASQGFVFQWASARISPREMTLSFDLNGHQVLKRASWNGFDPDDACRAVKCLMEKL